MKKFKILSVLIVTCLLITTFPTSIVADSSYSAVTGTISLPVNEYAPEEGIKVTLHIVTDNLTPSNKNDDVEATYDIIIPKGQSSHSYSVMVPKSKNTNAKYSVFYTVGNGYAPFGWYSTNGTTAIKADSTLIDPNKGDVKGVNIRILVGRIISGKIILGNNKVTLPQDFKYTITAVQKGSNNNSQEDDIIISKEVTVKAGEDDAEYQLIVPMNTPNNGYMLYYTYENNGYKETGYYHNSGTTRTDKMVTLVDVSNTVSGINFTTEPFTVIYGGLYLPEGVKASDSGVEAIITAENKMNTSKSTDDFSFMQAVTIKKENNSIVYSIAVPKVSTGYTVSYTISKGLGYITEGYYSKDGTVASKNKATMINTDDNPITGINLTILKKNTSTPTPTPGISPTPIPDIDKKYDLNGDGYVNIFDMMDLAEVISDKYEKYGYDEDLKQYEKRNPDYDDMKVFWDVFKPFANSIYKAKFNWKNYDWSKFDWSKFDWSNFDWSKFDWGNFDWSKFDWSNSDWSNYDWSKFDWNNFDWSNYDWSKFDWNNFDWSKFDWSKCDWGGWFDGKDNKTKTGEKTGSKNGKK